MMNQATAGPVVRTSLADAVHRRLVEDIVSGVLASGSALNVADIATAMQVSPSPVRDALIRLETEGLAVGAGNRRSYVAGFTRKDVIEIFELREFLECGAAALAAERIGAAALDELSTAIEECGSCAGDAARKKEMLDLDARFHELIAAAADNRPLREEIVRCGRQVRIMQWLRMRPARTLVARDEHLRIWRALKRRDAASAAEAMRRHIREAREFVLESFLTADAS